MPPLHPRQLPSSAEVARTLLAGVGAATLGDPLGAGRSVPAWHATLASGGLVLAVPAGRAADDATDGRHVRAGHPAHRPHDTAADDDWAVSLCVRAEASLPDLTVPRAHAEVLGWARPPHHPLEELEAVEALRRVWPLDAVPDYRVLLVDVAELRLHWVGGCVTLDGDDVRAAEVDPLWGDEAELLDRLRSSLSARLLSLVRGLGLLPLPDGRGVRLDRTVEARPVALDRYGLTVQCLDPSRRRHLLRLPFGRPIDAGEDAWSAISTEIRSQADCQTSCGASATAQDAAEPLET